MPNVGSSYGQKRTKYLEGADPNGGMSRPKARIHENFVSWIKIWVFVFLVDPAGFCVDLFDGGGEVWRQAIHPVLPLWASEII